MKDALDIFVYGNATVVIEALNAIAMLVGEKGYKTVFQISSIFALTYVVSQMFFGNSIKIAMKWFLTLYMVMSLMLIPKVDVLVSDPNFTPEGAVSNVPVGIAWPLSIITSIEKYLTESFESNFSTPDDLRYSQTGTIMTSDMVRKMSSVKIHDQDFSKNLQNFIQECVQYDLLRGRYPVQDLMHSEDVWKFVTTKYPPSHARAFLYDKNIETCADGAEKLEQEWGKTIKSSTSLLSKKIYTIFNREPMTDEKLNELFKSRLKLSYANLTGITKEASDIMQQNMMINAYHDAVLTKSSEVGAAAAVESYAVARATQNSRSQYKISGEVAGRLLPYIKAVIQVLLIGAFPIMAPLFVLGNGIMLAKRYFQVLLSLSIWGPLYAILNLQMTSSAKANLLFVAKGVKDTAAITIANLPGVEQVAADQALLAGYLALSVPLIAWGLVSGSMYAFASLASNVMAGAQSASAIAANEASTGNISLGNLNLDNVNAYNTSAFKLDDNASYMSGSMSMQQPDGVINTGFEAGNTAIDTVNANSRLPVEISGEAIWKSEELSAHREVQNHISSLQDTYTDAKTAHAHNLYQLAQEYEAPLMEGRMYRSSEDLARQKALHEFKDFVDKNASGDVGLLERLGFNASASVNTGVFQVGVGATVDSPASVAPDVDTQFNQKLNTATAALDGLNIGTNPSQALSTSHERALDSRDDLDNLRGNVGTQVMQATEQMTTVTAVVANNLASKTQFTQVAINALKTDINPETGEPYNDNDIRRLAMEDPEKLVELLHTMYGGHVRTSIEKGVEEIQNKERLGQSGDEAPQPENEPQRDSSAGKTKHSVKREAVARQLDYLTGKTKS